MADWLRGQEADQAAEELRNEDSGGYAKADSWEEAKRLVDSGHEPEKVILTGTSWTEMAKGIPKDLTPDAPYGRIQMLPEEDAEGYLAEMARQFGQESK